MKQEVSKYGCALTVGGCGSEGLIITPATFEPSNPLKRPPGWALLRQRRTASSGRRAQDVCLIVSLIKSDLKKLIHEHVRIC